MKFILLIASIAISVGGYSQTIQTIAGDGVSGFSGEGDPAINARFNRPVGIISDRWGNIYLATDHNNVIQKIDTLGILSRFAGSGLRGYSGDGGTAIAGRLSLKWPVGMAIDTIGNLYFCDSVVVRKIDTSGIISTFAGNGSAGYSGDGGAATAAQLNLPTGICIDKFGNLYILDAVVVRKVSTTGIISTIAGGGTFYLDGQPATNVILGGGVGIATDDSGNIYISDRVPFNYSRIRKINTAGIISTIAGGGSTTGSCNGCAATSLRLVTAEGLATDHDGSVYVAAGTDELVHKITPSGLAYHVAGNGSSGYSGVGGPATAAELNSPLMPCLDKKGDLSFADLGNYRFRKISLSTTKAKEVPKPQLLLQIFPNPHSGNNFSVKLSSPIYEEGILSISNILGETIFFDKIFTNQTKSISLHLASGLYKVTVQTATSNTTSILVSN